MDKRKIIVRTMTSRNAVVAEVQLEGSITVFVGSSKREPGEPFSATVGELLAMGRALERAGLHLQALGLHALEVLEESHRPRTKTRAPEQSEQDRIMRKIAWQAEHPDRQTPQTDHR